MATIPTTEESKAAGLGEAGGLALTLITASMGATHDTMDRLYEGERQHRRALEVLIEDALNAFDKAHQGTVREYEAAVNILRFGFGGKPLSAYADRHWDKDEEA